MAGVMTSSELWCAGITTVIVLIWALRSRAQSRFRGATVWPILGVLPSLIFHLWNLYDWLTRLLILNGGTARIPGPWKCRILTADPANIEYLLRTRYHNFGKGEIYKDIFRDMFGESVFVEDGEAFKRLILPITKAFYAPAFRDKVATAMPTVMHQNLLPLFSHACEKATVINLQSVFHRFACYNVWLFGAGVEIDCLKLEPGLPRVPFLEAFAEATQSVMIRWLMPPFCWKMLRRLNVLYERRFLKARDIVYAFVIQHSNSSPSNGAPRADIMYVLDRYMRESGLFCSDKLKTDLLVNLISGGMDSITSGLTWFFWLLAKNHRVEAEILAELRWIVKQRKITSPEDDEDPFSFSFEEVKRMEYLQAAVTESLRLYPSFPIDYVVSAEDDVLPDGTPVEKGAQIFYSIYSSGRLESVWGEDCLEFKPERWMKNGKFMRESEFKFVVFNGGPRRCTGMEFANWQMKWAAASILIRYSVKVDDKHPVLPKYGHVLSMKYGLLATVHQRENEDEESSYRSIPSEHL